MVGYGEADAIVTLFTRTLGKVAALARGARKSTKRLAGVLDSMHTVRVTLDERPAAELATLVEAALVAPRIRLLSDLSRLEAAGHGLRWVRSGSPPRTPEPEVWAEIVALLDRLDDPADPIAPATHLAATGLRLLAAFGYGLELSACIRCGRPCDEGRPAYVDAATGGLVCRACGGARHLLDAATRGRLAAAAAGRDAELFPEDTRIAQQLVDEALAAHAGFSVG